MKAVSVSYAARQAGRLKRRWPLRKAIVVAPQKAKNLEKFKELFLELANVKEAEFVEKVPEEIASGQWVSATEEEIQVLLDTYRDKSLIGEGLMRDLARRIQALRKELGFVPTEILSEAHVAMLDSDKVDLLNPFLEEMAELVRVRKVQLHSGKPEIKALRWHQYELDGQKILIAII